MASSKSRAGIAAIVYLIALMLVYALFGSVGREAATARVMWTAATGVAILGVFLVLLLWFFAREPARMDSELRANSIGLRERIDELESSGPRLVISDPFRTDRVTHRFTIKGVPTVASLDILYVNVSNEPVLRSERAAARDVVVQLEFWTDDMSRKLLSIPARWHDSPTPSAFGESGPKFDSAEILARDIPGNRHPFPISVVAQETGLASCYAYNNESFIRSGGDGKFDPYWLSQGSYRVRVVARGSNCDDAESWFTLRHTGVATLEPLTIDS